MSRQQPFPWLTTITLGVTAALTATRLTGDGVLDAVRRDPAALRHGQLWRLGSPVLVQSDRSPVTVLAVFALCAAIGAFAERLLSRRRWIAVYAVGALAGHSIGEAFQSHQSGTSVAFFGLLGGLAAYALLRRDPRLYRWRIHAAVAIPLTVLDIALKDIHGAAFLAGLAVASVWLLRDTARDRAHANGIPVNPSATTSVASRSTIRRRSSSDATSRALRA